MTESSYKKTQQRTCFICRKTADKKSLLRLVCRDGEVLLDREYRQSGRGVYLHAEELCLSRAVSPKVLNKKLWERVFKSSDINSGALKTVLEGILKNI